MSYQKLFFHRRCGVCNKIPDGFGQATSFVFSSVKLNIYFCFLLLLLAFVFKPSSQGKMLSLDRNLNRSASFDLALWCKCNLINYCKKYEPSKGYAQDNKYIIPGTTCGIFLC